MHYLTARCVKGFLLQIEHVKYAEIAVLDYNKNLKSKILS